MAAVAVHGCDAPGTRESPASVGGLRSTWRPPDFNNGAGAYGDRLAYELVPMLEATGLPVEDAMDKPRLILVDWRGASFRQFPWYGLTRTTTVR